MKTPHLPARFCRLCAALLLGIGSAATTAAAEENAARTVSVAPVQAPAALAQSLASSAERDGLQLFTQLVQQNLIAGLGKVPNLRVVQRGDLSQLLDEQNLGQSGNINPQTAAKVGELTGANTLLVVNLGQFDFMQRETRSAAINRDIVTVSVDASGHANLYDTSKGELIASSAGEGKAVNTQQYFANSQRQGGFNRVAVTEAARQLSDSIIGNLSAELYPAKVVSVTGNQVIINRGGSFFKVGDVVDVLFVGEELKDPDTGKSLGKAQVMIGKGKISRVTAQTSIATLSENNGVAVGHIVVAATE